MLTEFPVHVASQKRIKIKMFEVNTAYFRPLKTKQYRKKLFANITFSG